MKMSFRTPAVAMMATALIIGTPANAQTPGATAPDPSVLAGETLAPESASDADLEGARGGWVWVVIGAGASASLFVVRQCASRMDSCARGAVALFSTSRAARQWVCRRTGRLC